MHPYRTDTGNMGTQVRRAHARNARLAYVWAQPTTRCGLSRFRVGGRYDQFAYRMRGSDIQLLRCGLQAHIGNRNLRGNEALDRLVGSLLGLL